MLVRKCNKSYTLPIELVQQKLYAFQFVEAIHQKTVFLDIVQQGQVTSSLSESTLSFKFSDSLRQKNFNYAFKIFLT